MHAVLLNQFYPPSHAPTGLLLRDLADALALRGHRVTVLTSPMRYGTDGPAVGGCGVQGGATVQRIGPVGRHRVNLGSKLSDYVRYFLASYRAVARIQPSPDVVVCMTTPPFCGLIAERLARHSGAPYVLWCMDLYPEAIAASRGLRDSTPWLRGLVRAARRERSAAACVVTLGPDMTQRVRRSAPDARVEEIPVWSSLRPSSELHRQAADLRRQRGWGGDELVLMYTGHLGRAHSVEEFATLAVLLPGEGRRARMVFCGTGPARDDWRRRLGSLAEWLPPVDDAQLPAHLLSADILLCSARANWSGIIVPSKYQAACAIGRPTLFAGPGDSAVAQWIRSDDTGWWIASSGTEAVAAVIPELFDADRRRAKGQRALEQSRRCFARDTNLDRLVGCVESAARPETRRKHDAP